MKFFRVILPIILLTALMACSNDDNPEQPKPPEPTVEQLGEWLKTVPGVQSVQELSSQDYKKHYLVQFKQLIDPKNPTAGTFLQRVFLSHQDFDKPVVFEAEGYDAQSSMTGTEQTELTKHFKANRVIVEHRYAGQSIPSPRDWKYLTCENAAADLHAVRQALGTGYTGSWIATGVSKGGTNTMSYMMYYPNDMSAAVAYVGPICNSVADPRFMTHIQNVGTQEMRQRLVDFQREMLIRRDQIQPILIPERLTPSESLESLSSDQEYNMMVLELAQSIWQYGYPIDEIPETDATDEEMIEYMNTYDSETNSITPRRKDHSGMLIGDYLRKLRKRSTRANEEPDLYVHYFVQAIMELGHYAIDIEPFKDLLGDDHESWGENRLARFIVPADAARIPYSGEWNRQINQWLHNSDPRLICVYGEYDPWTAAAPDKNYFTGKTHMAIFVEKDGSHSAEIERLAPTDKQEAWTKLDSWVNK